MANELSKDQPRSIDYNLIVNTFTGWMFIFNSKVRESLEFIQSAEASLLKLVKYNIQGVLPLEQ
jgi:hypothetical protein